MFTITEVLTKLETGQEYAPRTMTSTPTKKSAEPKAAKAVEAKAPEPTVKTPDPAPAAKAPADAVAEPTGSDTPWREKMREKYGLKKKPGKV